MSAKSSSVVRALAATAFFAAVAAATTPAAAQAAPPVKPPAIAQTCAACHGVKGISTIKDTPSLAAQPDIFTQYQLVFMRDGARKPGVMQAIVKNLSDENIRDLGAYYALRQLPQGGFLRPGRERAAGGTAAGIYQKSTVRLSHRGPARARDGRHDRGVRHLARGGDRHDRCLSGAQALTLSLNSTHHPWSTSREKPYGLENTAYRRNRCRHGNQLLRLRRPVSAAAPQPRDKGGRPR